MTLPHGPLVAWYGDDFTGSAAVMEVLTFAGFPSVLFFDVPDAARLARFGALRGIGIAGEARAKSPAWMAQHLPPVYRALRETGAPIVHYKVCSTFDSAPHVGSIGAATLIAIDGMDWDPPWVPLVVGAPAIGRWQAFGNLFAAAGEDVHRLDRHPTMAVHPVTPMGEADICRHLAAQTGRSVGLVDLRTLQRGDEERVLADEVVRHEVVAIDVIDEATLRAAGALVWQHAKKMFAVGSQGLEYALVAHFAAEGLAPEASAPAHAGPVERVAVVSGSCSPLTAGQIAHAQNEGFEAIRIDAARIAEPDAWPGEEARAGEAALEALGAGRDPIVYTALGPDDPAITAFTSKTASDAAAGERLGGALGRILNRLVREGGVRRTAIAGGDTSSSAAQELGLYAVSAQAPLAPGAALLSGHSDDSAVDGLEIALKGGQMGGDSFFSDLRAGSPGGRG